MNTFFQMPYIDPVMFSLGPVGLHWYGVMYLLGFGFAYWLGMARAEKIKWSMDIRTTGTIIIQRIFWRYFRRKNR